jgi:hypothetical protein
MRDKKEKDYWHTTETATDKISLFLNNIMKRSLTLAAGGKDAGAAHSGPARESNWQQVQLLKTPVY